MKTAKLRLENIENEQLRQEILEIEHENLSLREKLEYEGLTQYQINRRLWRYWKEQKGRR